jgi:cobalt-zinc-cadmium efflux system membrane fusion protein
VSARVIVAERTVPLAVRAEALQTLDAAQVVFERRGEAYEARALKLGRSDGMHVEVLGGIEPGAEYVTRNSYLIKADLEKSGAGHDH